MFIEAKSWVLPSSIFALPSPNALESCHYKFDHWSISDFACKGSFSSLQCCLRWQLEMTVMCLTTDLLSLHVTGQRLNVAVREALLTHQLPEMLSGTLPRSPSFRRDDLPASLSSPFIQGHTTPPITYLLQDPEGSWRVLLAYNSNLELRRHSLTQWPQALKRSGLICLFCSVAGENKKNFPALFSEPCNLNLGWM